MAAFMPRRLENLAVSVDQYCSAIHNRLIISNISIPPSKLFRYNDFSAPILDNFSINDTNRAIKRCGILALVRFSC
jgi:hypothetical protein